ncbi:DNA alkylation repair protein [Bacteroidota bacterium]
MAERLKDLFFSDSFISELGIAIKGVYPDFDQAEFNRLIYADDWKSKELKEMMHHTSYCLAETLPKEYPAALKILKKIAPNFNGFNSMIFPDFVEKCGLDDWELSLPALAFFTKLCSSEFAIRPFLAKDPELAMSYMYKWAEDEDFHLRRLASEGCRPRLPWAMALSEFKKDPAPILRIMETLKDDPNEYVRMSVANNLNDISKDHPDIVLDICESWYGQSKNRDWIVKRACRTMLKEGNKRALILFGFGDPGQINVEGLSFDRQALTIGESLRFSFEIQLISKEVSRVRLEYGVDFVKANNKLSRKIFQIREADFKAGSYTINKKHSFQDLSTRKHYPGQHQITIIVNGVEKAKGTIELG